MEEDTVQQFFLNNSEILQTITGEQQTQFGVQKADHRLVKIVTPLKEDLFALLRQAEIKTPHLLKATTEQFKAETLTTLLVSVPDEDLNKLMKLSAQGHFSCLEVKSGE